MERAPERSPNHPSVASVAGRRRRSAESARAAGPRRWVGPRGGCAMRGLRTGANGLRHPARWGVGMTAWCQEGAARYAGAVHGACQQRGRGVNTSRDVAGTAQTPASAERQGVGGTTEEMGAGECTQTPGAPAAGRIAAATRLRDKCALPHGVPLMAPLTPALKAPSTHPLPPRLPCRMGNWVLLWTGRRCRPHLCALWCGWMS